MNDIKKCRRVITADPIDKAILRELYEETGVAVKNLQRVLFDDDVTENWKGAKKHFIMLLYTSDFVSGNLMPAEGDDDNLAEIRLFSPDELKAIKFPLL